MFKKVNIKQISNSKNELLDLGYISRCVKNIYIFDVNTLENVCAHVNFVIFEIDRIKPFLCLQ